MQEVSLENADWFVQAPILSHRYIFIITAIETGFLSLAESIWEIIDYLCIEKKQSFSSNWNELVKNW